MLCKVPFRPQAGVEYGCGQCLPCRINKRREWTARLVLEMSTYASPTAFFTLTYAPEWLPADGSVVPADIEDFRRKLRYVLGSGFRYYFVAEYGERTGRPHYHGLLFGVVPSLSVIERAWSVDGKCRGKCDVSVAGVDVAGYVAGYVTKKWTKKDHKDLRGRHREFARMSRKPGIGADGVQSIIDWLYSSEGATYLQRYRDVPKTVRFNGAIFPLGRYLVTRIRLAHGIDVSDRDPVRAKLQMLQRLDQASPDLRALRELKRVNHARKAQFYASLKRAKEKL